MLVWATPRLLPHLGAVVGVETKARVPRYALTALDGTALSPEALRGKVVLVNFWATWCLPCRVTGRIPHCCRGGPTPVRHPDVGYL